MIVTFTFVSLFLSNSQPVCILIVRFINSLLSSMALIVSQIFYLPIFCQIICEDLFIWFWVCC